MNRAGFWRRVLAFVIDYALIMAFALAVETAIAPYVTVSQFERFVAVSPAVIWVAYFALEVYPGTTVGKLVTRLQIARPDGMAVDRWTLLTRYLTKHFGMFLAAVADGTENLAAHFLSSVALLFVGIGFLRVLGEDKQAWHDVWSRTAVYRRTLRTAPGFPVEAVAPAPAPDAPIGAPPPL